MFRTLNQSLSLMNHIKLNGAHIRAGRQGSCVRLGFHKGFDCDVPFEHMHHQQQYNVENRSFKNGSIFRKNYYQGLRLSIGNDSMHFHNQYIRQ